MSTEKWRMDRRKLQGILDKLVSGNVTVETGAAEYVTSLKRRIAILDAKLAQESRQSNECQGSLTDGAFE